MVEISTGKHSPIAMSLSFVCPGLGQLYLRKIKKSIVIFLVAAMGIALIYINSLPVSNFTDLFHWGVSQGGPNGYLIWKFKSGSQLMFRPHWYFKLSGLVQFVIIWLYGIIDGWMGRRIYKRRKDEGQEGEMARGQGG